MVNNQEWDNLAASMKDPKYGPTNPEPYSVGLERYKKAAEILEERQKKNGTSL